MPRCPKIARPKQSKSRSVCGSLPHFACRTQRSPARAVWETEIWDMRKLFGIPLRSTSLRSFGPTLALLVATEISIETGEGPWWTHAVHRTCAFVAASYTVPGAAVMIMIRQQKVLGHGSSIPLRRGLRLLLNDWDMWCLVVGAGVQAFVYAVSLMIVERRRLKPRCNRSADVLLADLRMRRRETRSLFNDDDDDGRQSAEDIQVMQDLGHAFRGDCRRTVEKETQLTRCVVNAIRPTRGMTTDIEMVRRQSRDLPRYTETIDLYSSDAPLRSSDEPRRSSDEPDLEIPRARCPPRTLPLVVVDAMSHVHVPPSMSSAPSTLALDRFSMTIRRSDVCAVIGPNGAGKSTLLNLLCATAPCGGLVKPTSGDAFVGGHAISEGAVASGRVQGVGFCPQGGGVVNGITVRNNLEFFAKIRGVETQAELDAVVLSLSRSFSLEHDLHRVTEQCSGGTIRKLCFALAFVGGTELHVLDEPTSGIDVVARKIAWDAILQPQNSLVPIGDTILLSSHALSEAESTCSKIAVIFGGRLHAVGTCEGIRRALGRPYSVIVHFSPPRCPNSGEGYCNEVSDESVDHVRMFLEFHFEVATLDARSHAWATYRICLGDRRLSESMLTVSQELPKLPNVTSFSMSHATLEETYLALIERTLGRSNF
eukprot:Polyplicarium_translucidae@DN1888_c0_g1_i3.p1